MAKSNGLNFNLPSVDDLFSTEEERAEARLEKVVNLSFSEISDFPNHPFKVRMDEAMREMTESVKQYGVLVPALVRPKRSGGYEMVAGHRRKKAADLAGLAAGADSALGEGVCLQNEAGRIKTTGSADGFNFFSTG